MKLVLTAFSQSSISGCRSGGIKRKWSSTLGTWRVRLFGLRFNRLTEELIARSHAFRLRKSNLPCHIVKCSNVWAGCRVWLLNFYVKFTTTSTKQMFRPKKITIFLSTPLRWLFRLQFRFIQTFRNLQFVRATTIKTKILFSIQVCSQ